MTANGWLQIGLFLLVVFLVTKPLGIFMARVFSREKTFLDPALRPIERLIYRLCGVDEKQEMRWTEYGAAMLLFGSFALGGNGRRFYYFRDDDLGTLVCGGWKR